MPAVVQGGCPGRNGLVGPLQACRAQDSRGAGRGPKRLREPAGWPHGAHALRRNAGLDLAYICGRPTGAGTRMSRLRCGTCSSRGRRFPVLYETKADLDLGPMAPESRAAALLDAFDRMSPGDSIVVDCP